MSAIKNDDVMEFVGQLIDTFEDFLEERGVTQFPSFLCDDGEANAIIVGEHYDNLSYDIEAVLRGWKIID